MTKYSHQKKAKKEDFVPRFSKKKNDIYKYQQRSVDVLNFIPSGKKFSNFVQYFL